MTEFAHHMPSRMRITWAVLEAAQDAGDEMVIAACRRIIARLNRIWMNNSGAPEIYDEGFGMLVGQSPNAQDSFLVVRDAHGTELLRQQTSEKWVIPTGGAFLFSPSISFFANLGLVA